MTYKPRPNTNTLANNRREPAVDTLVWNPYIKDWVAKATPATEPAVPKPAEAEAFSTPGVEGQDPLDLILPPELLEMLEPVMGSSSSSPATERERATIRSAHQAGAKVYRLNFLQQIIFIIAFYL